MSHYITLHYILIYYFIILYYYIILYYIKLHYIILYCILYIYILFEKQWPHAWPGYWVPPKSGGWSEILTHVPWSKKQIWFMVIPPFLGLFILAILITHYIMLVWPSKAYMRCFPWCTKPLKWLKVHTPAPLEASLLTSECRKSSQEWGNVVKGKNGSSLKGPKGQVIWSHRGSMDAS